MVGATSTAASSISPISNFFISSKSSSSSNGKNSMLLFSNLPPASRISVKNLSYTTGEASLIKLFAKFGPVVEVKLAKHEETKKSKGYAFIQYTCQDDAILAIEHMDENVRFQDPFSVIQTTIVDYRWQGCSCSDCQTINKWIWCLSEEPGSAASSKVRSQCEGIIVSRIRLLNQNSSLGHQSLPNTDVAVMMIDSFL